MAGDSNADAGKDMSHFRCKRSDLPVYTSLRTKNNDQTQCEAIPKNSKTRETIESGVSAVRAEVTAGVQYISKYTEKLDGYIDTAKSHTQSTIDYLNEPQNTLPRSGAIAVGGLAGFIFAARSGVFKKLLYPVIGAGAVASICYPRQSEALARDALSEACKSYTIASNFVKGVKPGDEIGEEVLKFPKSLDDVKSLALDLYDDAKESLFPKKK